MEILSMKSSDPKSIMIIGIGNDSRQDDGLGWSLLNMIEEEFQDRFELIYKYQLNIEDADLIKEAEQVLFVDACRDDCLQGCEIVECVPNGTITFTTHALSPAAILALCQQVYNKSPKAYILKLQGFEWELKTGLTKQGYASLVNGFGLFKKFIGN